MKTKLVILIAGLGLLAPAYGHHSFAAEFDQRKPITLKGCVTKVEWMESAHALFHRSEGPGGESRQLGS